MSTALLVIDMQMAQFARPVHDGDGVVARIAGLIGRARASNVPVFHVQHAGPEDSPFAPGSAGWQFHPLLVPAPGDAIVAKQHGSAFHGTDLHIRLVARRVNRLVITGMKTQYCIDGACRGAAALDYQAVLVGDAHTTADNDILDARQIIAHHNKTLGDGYVSVCAAADVIF
ncbi:cysteine hydrolase family protein [Telmatospirillum sp.]|uniref:cysteine hydrolase family protein n=1 Tax=Telmatospirillum sp. TaxID=2079197 RepID=UPI00284B59D8|nr:cysteine hydrolase family protein [Telmatospirillum sp.]MDR3435246.1 cysteine hydrolase family protein [Telmatospirillum sp.]